MKILRVVAVFALLLSVACGGGSTVGEGVEAEGLTDEARRLGEFVEEETAADQEKAALGAKEEEQQEDTSEQDAQQAAEEAEAQREQQIEQQKEQAAVDFAITAGGYDPYYIRILPGGTVKVTNHDAQPRSVTADKGEFDSGLLQPGESWVGGPFNEVGKFGFHDETRPYVVGTLEVCSESGC